MHGLLRPPQGLLCDREIDTLLWPPLGSWKARTTTWTWSHLGVERITPIWSILKFTHTGGRVRTHTYSSVLLLDNDEILSFTYWTFKGPPWLYAAFLPCIISGGMLAWFIVVPLSGLGWPSYKTTYITRLQKYKQYKPFFKTKYTDLLREEWVLYVQRTTTK